MQNSKTPGILAERMSRSQAQTLRALSNEAYQPKMYVKELTGAEAVQRIQALRAEIELANSF